MNAHTHTDFAAAEATSPRKRRRHGPSWSHSTHNPALGAAIAALHVQHDEFERLFDAHTAADEARSAILQQVGTPRPPHNGMAVANAEPDPAPKEYRAALRATEASDRAQVKARGQLDTAAKAMLKIKVTTIEDALLKGRAYAWCQGYDQTGALDFEEDIALVLAALQRDILGLTDAGPPNSHPDADLLALGEEFDAAWTAEMAYDISQGDDGYEALYGAASILADRIRRMRATTLDGFRVQARVVQWCQTSTGDRSEPVELIAGDDTSDSRTAQAIVNGLLGVEDVSKEGFAIEDYLAARPGAIAWEAARADFLSARDAYDGMGDQESAEGNEAFLRLIRALLTYVQTPPADTHQLAIQMTDAINFDGLPDFDGRAEDPAAIQKLLDDDEAAINYLAMTYQHVQRLAGHEGPILDVRRALPAQRGETDAEFIARLSVESDDNSTLTEHDNALLAVIREYEEMGGRVAWCVAAGQSGIHTLHPHSIDQRDREEELHFALLQPDVHDRLRRVLQITGRVAIADEDAIAAAAEPQPAL